MNATDVMRRPVVSVSPGATARSANALLVDHGFAALPVVDEDGYVSGTFDDEAERRVVTALVRTVPGVTGVVLRDLGGIEGPTTSAARWGSDRYRYRGARDA